MSPWKLWVLAGISAVCIPLHLLGAEPPRGPVIAGGAVVLENESCRYEIGLDGKNRSLIGLGDKQECLQPGQPFMLLGRGTKSWASSKVELAGDLLAVSFGDSGISVRAKAAIRPRYFTLTVEGIAGGTPDWLQFCNLRTKIGGHAGALVNTVWNDRFAVGALACNDRTDCGTHGVPSARAYREYGIEGAKVAIFAVPTGRPDPGNKVLDAIEGIELEQGLPHPMFNGVWIKRAPERFASYLMVSGINQRNIDDVIRFAKGGFGCVELTWWRSTPTYEPNPAQFPEGMAGLKAVADKIHAAGLQVGLHTMQGMVGWGPKNDPYLIPKADPRLLQDRHATLAAPVATQATEIAVQEPLADWPDQGDLYLEGEIVGYAKRTATAFTECKRGLHGTTVAAHAQGARVGHLVNCFPIWGHTVYCPDVNSTMIDEICDRIAKVFDATGADMSYFDGGEEIHVQPPHWRNQGRIALGVQKRVKKPVILEGNALYTHLSWHVITRGSPSYDPIYFGRREYTLRFKGQNPAGWAANLLTGDVGWFAPHVHSPATDAVTPDEVMLLCLKALGGKAPISFSVNANNLWANKRMPEMGDIIRTCDELKRRDYFSEEACAELVKPMAEHVLERTADGQWDLRPLQFGPPRVVDAAGASARWTHEDPYAAGASARWTHKNPYAEQSPWIRIRGRTALAPYGGKKNLVLADPHGGAAFEVRDAASAELVQAVEPSAEKAPDGTSTFCYRAENRAKTRSAWCRATLALPKPLNLSRHRRLGLWIRSDAPGGILNVQLAATDARRDHYIPLGNQGWSYVVLDPPEEGRFYDYSWPYRFTDLFYTCWNVYGGVKELNLYFNGLPPGAEARCWIGRIEALEERPLPLVSPALEAAGQKITFPVSLKPDEYLEMEPDGRCRHFDPNGGLLGDVNPQGALRLAAGETPLRFACTTGEAASPRAEVTLSLRGAPIPNARRSKGP